MPIYQEINVGQSYNKYTGEIWDKLDIKATLEPNETVEQCHAAVKQKVVALLSSNPDTVIQKKESIGTDEDIYALMDKCETLNQLKAYELVAHQKQTTKDFYDNKMKSIINNH